MTPSIVLTLKGTSLRGSTSFEPSSVKIGHIRRYISPTCGEVSTELICTEICTVGVSPQVNKIECLCDSLAVLSCPLFLSGTRPGRTVGPIFARDGSNDVFTHKEVRFGG